MNTVPTPMHISMMITYFAQPILRFTPLVYLSVTRPNQLLNLKKNLLRPFFSFLSSVGFSNSVHNAGVSDKAMNADSITDIAIVIANC